MRPSPPAGVGAEDWIPNGSRQRLRCGRHTRDESVHEARRRFKNGSEQVAKKRRNPDFHLSYSATLHPPRLLKSADFPLHPAKTPMPGPLVLAPAPSVPLVPDGRYFQGKILSRLFRQEIFERNRQRAVNTERSWTFLRQRNISFFTFLSIPPKHGAQRQH